MNDTACVKHVHVLACTYRTCTCMYVHLPVQRNLKFVNTLKYMYMYLSMNLDTVILSVKASRVRGHVLPVFTGIQE